MLKIAQIESAISLKCIGNNIYVGSSKKGLIKLSADGTVQETLSDVGCIYMTVFNNTLCYLNKDAKEVQLFKDS